MQFYFDSINRALTDHANISLCILFGSALSGKISPDSDVDIGVAASGPLSLDERLELINSFASALRREVDLVDLTAARGLILQQILCKGKIVRNHDKMLYARLILRMLFDQADMMPYHDRILRERRRRFLNG